MKGLDGHPEIFELVKKEDDKRVFGNRWHSDQMYTPIPAKATILYAKQLPPVGGDTIFADLYAAYDALSDGMKAMLAGVRTFNNGENKARYGGLSRAEWYKTASTGGMGNKVHDDGAPDAEVIAEHPLIRTHPETGRKALYIGDQTERFAGMTDRGKQAAAGLPDGACAPAGIHLPLPLARRLARALGQPLHHALRGRRLRRPAPGHAPVDDQGRRRPGVSRPLDRGQEQD